MATEVKMELADSEQDEEEDVYEVERIIDMRLEEGEVLYRVRWKNYCSDDDTWEPEAHLEDCREVLLAYKKAMGEAKAKKEAEAKKSLKLPSKSDVFDADSESDSDKDRPVQMPIKKKKKKKIREEDELPTKDKKKKKEKRKDEVRPLPAPETDEEEEEDSERAPTPSSPSKEKRVDSKKRLLDSEEDDDELVPSKKHKKEKGKDGGKHKKEKLEEGKKKKAKKDRKIETSDEEAAAPLEDDLSDGPLESQLDDSTSRENVMKSTERLRLDDKSKLKKGKWEVKLQGLKDLVHDKKSKKPDSVLKETSLQKLKGLTSKSKEDNAPHSDSSDSSTLHKKVKTKGQDSTSATLKALSSSTSSSSSSSVSLATSTKVKEDDVAKEELLGQKDSTGSTNLFEKFLLNCEAKDRAPRRQPSHQPPVEKNSGKPSKLLGKLEKFPKPSKESPAQKPEAEKTERTKQSDGSKPSQSYGFNLDSDEREGEEITAKPRIGEDLRERRDRPEEPQRPSWERRSSTDDKRKRREDSEPRRLLIEDHKDSQEPPEDKGQATLSLGMDLNLDWMTLDDFQKHLNGEDEILSGPPLTPSELRDAVKCGDYMAVKLALNSKEDYNLDQEMFFTSPKNNRFARNPVNKPMEEDIENMKYQDKMNPLKQACTIGEKRSFEGERSLIEERSTNDALRLTANLDSSRNEECSPSIKENILQVLDCPKDVEEMLCSPGFPNTEQVTMREHENILKGGNDITEFKKKDCDSIIEQKSDVKKDRRQAEEDEMFDDTKGGSSNEMSLDAVWMLTRDDEKTVIKDIADKQWSPQEANYEAEDVVADQSDCTDQAQSEMGTKEIVKRRSQRCGKTSEKKEPTRSSLRTCKKVLEATPSTVEERKEPSKKHFCLYCKMAFTQLAKHLEKKHAEETDVAHAIHFPKGSKVRQTLLDQIRNKGDYEHNCHVVKSGEGQIFSKKQVKNPTISVRDFLPCQHCFAFYRKTDLWRHERSCKARKGDQKSSERTNGVTSTAHQLLPMSEFLTGGCEEIIHIMHQDDISRHIRNDPLICKYGNALSVKYEHDKSQFAYIAQKMRELGRFVLAVNELDNSVRYLHELCLPSKFALAVEGAKKASGFDPSSSKFKTVSLVSKIGYSLKRAAEIAFGESRMTEDSDTESEVKKFIQLLDTKWSECFSRKALALSLKQDVKKVEVDKSTVTEDLMKLHRFIAGEEDEAREELKESPSMSTWKKLSEATLADVCLFNRGRVGNIGRMLLQTYTCKKCTGTFLPSSDQIRKSTKLELDLGAYFTRLELEGQYGRNMLVLLTERMVLSIDLLIENRHQAGVSKTNPYLFARTEGPSFIRGLDCFRRAAVECGVRNPEALLSSSLREQIASCWQVMSLNERELDQVAKLVGKSSEECYMLSRNPLQLEEVSKQLLKMDRTLPSTTSTPTTTKDGTSSKPALKRRPWSEEEQAAVKRYLSDFITTLKVPGKKQCNACISAEPDLRGRSWTDVKNYVHNTLQTVRRRNNQQTSEGNVNTLNPKSRKAGVQTTKNDLEDTNDICTMTTVHPDHLTGSSNYCMTMAPPINLRESSTPFSQEMISTYASFSSTTTNMVHTSQSLMSSFTPLNATDTQVVPTFTPLSTTNALIPPAYTSENNHILPLSSYTQNAAILQPSSVYSLHDTTGSAMIPSFSSLNAPSTSMVPTFTSLNTSSSMIPVYSPLDDSSPIVSSFTPLNHSGTPSYPTDPPRAPTTAQVVPTILGHTVPDKAPVVQEGAPKSTKVRQTNTGEKPQKRNKRLWSEEEQAAVRRQFGDFCKLVKVPGKKDCDACLAAEPALNTRTWREVKYFVHNSIQSMKRKGHAVASKQCGGQEPETHNLNADWDGPVYLSL
ncbi:M-phase phosphoprotein 8 isoform X2 [Pleuronectes platessa]|uniref:M-phase phosphoprotein 8 isoform X2 n=1 Tax=Pleuronectes platessa TaxID=8262 RepID=UPI00232A607B|nr:M-phase phosphoprotein 8 isoform X2 [Pleuronectes platessa]